MYLSMASLGEENTAELMRLTNEEEKWHLVYQVASNFGFAGIQVNPDSFDFALKGVPDLIRRSFRLTYHPGGSYLLNTSDEEQALHRMLAESLDIGKAIGAEDVSIHPPLVAEVKRLPLSQSEYLPGSCAEARDGLHSILSVWIPKFRAAGMTLSLETHFTPLVFVYDGIRDFSDFCLSLPGLGVLVDVSHNFFDGYSISEQISVLKPLKITGFHLSDAMMGKTLQEGTHLPLGTGSADFSPLTEYLKDNSIYGAFEIREPAKGISESIAYLRNLGE